VKLRNKIVNEDGTVERWKQPRLADWEVPRRDPSEPRPQHPEVAARRRAARQRWRVRQRARTGTARNGLVEVAIHKAGSHSQESSTPTLVRAPHAQSPIVPRFDAICLFYTNIPV
jgi:hypothetical protein